LFLLYNKEEETHLFFAIISLQFFWEGGLYRCLLVSKIIKLLRQFNKNSELIPASCKSCVSRPTNSRRAVRIGRKMKIHVKFIIFIHYVYYISLY